MAIIKTTKTFEGGEFKQGGGNYLKSNVRVMNFRDKQHIDGVYVFILGAYKEDQAGNGVWYKPLKIRDNFGLGTKEKFAVQPNCPVEYFAERMKTYAPNMSRTEKLKGEDGKDRTVYPVFGRTTWRVLYNAAFFNELTPNGIHVMDLPVSGGGSAIDEFVRGKQPDGSDNPMLNDYQASYPVHIKLDLKAAGQPWKIRVNDSKAYSLPIELADTEFLYNLDEVVQYPSKNELIDKLRTIVPPDIFAKCMAGYTDGSVSVSLANTNREEDDLPFPPATTPASTPKLAAPVSKSVAPVARPTPASVAPSFSLPEASDGEDLPKPPVTTAANLSSAKQFLRKPSVAA